MDERLLLDITELKMIRFECGACRTAIAVPTALWTQPLVQCPNCGVAWSTSNQQAYQLVQRLSVALRGILAVAEKEDTYKIQFELARPKP